MKYKTLNTKESLSLCLDLNSAPKGTRLVFDQPLHIKDSSDGTKVFALGDDFLFTGEDSAAITAGLAHIEVPEPEPAPEPFEIPLLPIFKNVGEQLPSAVQWDKDGYSYRIFQDGTLLINGLDRGGFYRTIMSADGNKTLADRVYSIAKRIFDSAHREVHPLAIALDLELFIESLTAEDETSAISISVEEMFSEPVEQSAPADPFDHPAFEGWDNSGNGSRLFTFEQKQIALYAHGGITWSDSPWHDGKPLMLNKSLAANLPEAAEIINRLAPVAPAEVVAAAVVAFVKSKEAGK